MRLAGFFGRLIALLMGLLLALPASATCYHVTAEGSEPISATLELDGQLRIAPPGAPQSTSTPWIKSTLTIGGTTYSSAAGGMIVSPTGGIFSSVMGGPGTGWAVALEKLAGAWTASSVLPTAPPQISQWEDAYITILRAGDVKEAHKITSISSCAVPCRIVPEALAEKPLPLDRKRLGVGEITKLSLPGSAEWSIAGAGQLRYPKGAKSPSFVGVAAGDRAGHIVVSARLGQATCKIEFDVVEPNEVKIRATKLIYHHRGVPDSGFQAEVYFRPEDVSFSEILVQEQQARYVANRSLAELNGHLDHPNPNWIPIDKWVSGLGSRMRLHDQAYSGYAGCASPPFVASEVTLTTPWQYKVGEGEPKTFAIVLYRGTIEPDGVTLTSRKTDANTINDLDGQITTSVDSATSGENEYQSLIKNSEVIPCH